MARVLVAEDDKDERDLMAFRLEQAGFEVLTRATGEGVLDALDSGVVAPWCWSSTCAAAAGWRSAPGSARTRAPRTCRC